jgi:hypothetical protein
MTMRHAKKRDNKPLGVIFPLGVVIISTKIADKKDNISEDDEASEDKETCEDVEANICEEEDDYVHDVVDQYVSFDTDKI